MRPRQELAAPARPAVGGEPEAIPQLDRRREEEPDPAIQMTLVAASRRGMIEFVGRRWRKNQRTPKPSHGRRLRLAIPAARRDPRT
jgi:hypothetical protein